MLNKVAIAALVLIAAGGPAIAQDCGSLPIAPVIPTASEIQSKTPADASTSQHNAYQDIKRWQADLKDYRACLDSLTNSQKRDLQNEQGASKPDKDKIKGIQDNIAQTSRAFDSSVDTEEKVVNEFHAMQTAYCSRQDVNRASCPKT